MDSTADTVVGSDSTGLNVASLLPEFSGELWINCRYSLGILLCLVGRNNSAALGTLHGPALSGAALASATRFSLLTHFGVPPYWLVARNSGALKTLFMKSTNAP